MKKILSFIFILFSTLILSSCNSEKTPIQEDDGIYDVVFHVDSDSISNIIKQVNKNESITFDYIDSNVYNGTIPVKNKHTYTSEWFIDSNYTNPVSFPYTITKDTNFYLKWIRNIYTYDVNYYVDGKIYSSIKQNDTELLTKPADPEKRGYTFEGWYTNEDLTTKFDFLSYIEGNTNLYAKFNHIDYNFSEIDAKIKQNLSDTGYINKDNLPIFSDYINTSAYRTVSNADELLQAIADAKLEYTSNWVFDPKTDDEKTKVNRLNELNEKRANNTISKEENSERVAIEKELDILKTPGHLVQNLTKDSIVHVIEVTNDINLGYKNLSSNVISLGVVDDFNAKNSGSLNTFTMSKLVTENGISQVKIQNTNNLLIYSKNGAKFTCGGFKLTSSSNIVFRNLEFDEMWQWEDTSNKSINAVGDYDAFGWAYFKISFSENIWIDHCSFGKSYDGQIDYSNPFYTNRPTAFRAPYNSTGGNGLHISWCEFNAGSDDKDGYLYKMMQDIEKDYKNGGENYLYYNSLRDAGYTFEQILYGLAIPQKKGFLLGDSGDEFTYNYEINVSFANCIFKNLEDRLPKIRGGHVYMYNCVVDSLEYFEYRTLLKELNSDNINAQVAVMKVNTTWKCALVSQGILSGLGASITAENCIFKGIDQVLKNNDSSSVKNELQNPNATVNGGYKIINCIYQKNKNSEPTTVFPNSSETKLSESNFNWHTSDGNAPFSIIGLDLEKLENDLTDINYGVGTTAYMEDKWLIFNYQ